MQTQKFQKTYNYWSNEHIADTVVSKSMLFVLWLSSLSGIECWLCEQSSGNPKARSVVQTWLRTLIMVVYINMLLNLYFYVIHIKPLFVEIPDTSIWFNSPLDCVELLLACE